MFCCVARYAEMRSDGYKPNPKSFPNCNGFVSAFHFGCNQHTFRDWVKMVTCPSVPMWSRWFTEAWPIHSETDTSIWVKAFISNERHTRGESVLGHRSGRTPSAADSGGRRGRGSRGGGWIGIGFGIRSWVRDDEAAAFVPLHVTYAPDGLQLRFRGTPVVPVFKFTVFKDELTPAITRVHVAHPSETQHSNNQMNEYVLYYYWRVWLQNMRSFKKTKKNMFVWC